MNESCTRDITTSSDIVVSCDRLSFAEHGGIAVLLWPMWLEGRMRVTNVITNKNTIAISKHMSNHNTITVW